MLPVHLCNILKHSIVVVMTALYICIQNGNQLSAGEMQFIMCLLEDIVVWQAAPCLRSAECWEGVGMMAERGRNEGRGRDKV